MTGPLPVSSIFNSARPSVIVSRETIVDSRGVSEACFRGAITGLSGGRFATCPAGFVFGFVSGISTGSGATAGRGLRGVTFATSTGFPTARGFNFGRSMAAGRLLVPAITGGDTGSVGGAGGGGKGGGGRPDMAQAGGPDGGNAQAALDAIEAALGA